MTAPEAQSIPDPPSARKVSLPGGMDRRWVIFTSILTVLLGAVLVLVVVVISQQQEIKSSCNFFRPLTSLAPAVAAPAKKPSELGVSIISGARIAYGGEGCGTPLKPASAVLVRWERYYHLPTLP